MKNVFDFIDYRLYLRHRFGGPGTRNGSKSRAAAAIGCHSTFLSHVLQGKADFNLEQADRLNDFFGHSPGEAHFFLLLLQLARAGTTKLKNYFRSQIEDLIQQRSILTNRVPDSNKISSEAAAKFYSSWIYGAAHVLLSIPELQDRERLSAFLNLTSAQTMEILEFLQSIGLAIYESGRYRMGPNHIHLSGQSENINKHHTNWRMRAIQALDFKRPQDLHYSAVVTLSRADAAIIKEKLLENMHSNIEVIRGSKEEEAYVYCFDFFPLRFSEAGL